MMTPPNEPTPDEIEEITEDEEHDVLESPDVPDDTKAEVDEHMQARREAELDEEHDEGWTDRP